MKLLTTAPDRVMVRYVLPAAIRCFFHVYEEHLGRYGLRVLKHLLVFPGRQAHPKMKTGCNWHLAPHDYVTVTNDVVVDRAWCRTCAAAFDAESRRRHAPYQPEEIVHPLTKEVL